jgi:hypothetical protein
LRLFERDSASTARHTFRLDARTVYEFSEKPSRNHLGFRCERPKTFRRFNPQQLQSARATGLVFYLSAILGTAAVLLQLYNAAILNAFWPFFTAIVVQLVAATVQFARIILKPPEQDDSSN